MMDERGGNTQTTACGREEIINKLREAEVWQAKRFKEAAQKKF
jgi:hypothetical protein